MPSVIISGASWSSNTPSATRRTICRASPARPPRSASGAARPRLINRPSRGNRPDAFDPVAADPDIPVVEVDGRVAMARHQPDLVAEPQAVRRAADREPAVLVRGALIGCGRLVPHRRRPGIEGQRLQTGI